MRQNFKLILFCLLTLGIGFLLAAPFLASPANAQIFYLTPTAEANGNIYYVVKEGETCDSIALLTNVSLETLRNLNQLDLDQCRFLQVGQKLLLGTVPTPVITVGPSPTPTSNIPTPQPLKGFGTICVYLFDDVNGDAMAQEEEITNTGLAGGEVNVSSQAGDFNRTGTTLGTGEALCFEDAPEGDYTVSVAIPDGYNPTANQNHTLTLKAGDTATIDFSAQASSSLAIIETAGNSSVFLAVIGGIIIVAGIGLALYVKFVLRR